MTAVMTNPIDACCSPVLSAPLSAAEAEQLAAAFKVIADPARLRLLGLIAAAAEACTCELVAPLGLSQPTVSHHLKVLHDAGLVTREHRGRWTFYRVAPERLAVLRASLDHPVAAGLREQAARGMLAPPRGVVPGSVAGK